MKNESIKPAPDMVPMEAMTSIKALLGSHMWPTPM